MSDELTNLENAQLIRAYFLVRNHLLMQRLAELSFLQRVAGLRQAVMARQGSVPAYVAFMIGSLAAIPVQDCQLYGPRVDGAVALPAWVETTTPLIKVLAAFQPEALPIRIVVPSKKKGQLEIAL